jgi:uncharacterized GH25 family protein
MMKKSLLAAAFAAILGGTAQAHEVWIERDGDGPARIYLGEPAEPLPQGGDPEFDKLKAPRLLSKAQPSLVRKQGFIEVAAAPGDVRAWDDAVFAPWGDEGKKEAVIYYARAGRAENRALLPFEIVPVAAHATRFTVIRDGKPVPDAKVTIVSPEKWTKAVAADANGQFDLPAREDGRYLLSAAQKEQGKLEAAGQTVAVLHRITTTSFVLP